MTVLRSFSAFSCFRSIASRLDSTMQSSASSASSAVRMLARMASDRGASTCRQCVGFAAEGRTGPPPRRARAPGPDAKRRRRSKPIPQNSESDRRRQRTNPDRQVVPAVRHTAPRARRNVGNQPASSAPSVRPKYSPYRPDVDCPDRTVDFQQQPFRILRLKGLPY